MPTLHLPAAHTDNDVALAAGVATAIGSHALYVAWTHGEGAGLPPEVETIGDAAGGPAPAPPFAGVFWGWARALAALGPAIPRPPPTNPAPAIERPPRTRPATEESV